MAAHVLVLANVTAASGDLIDAIRQRAEKGPIDVTLLMPGQGPGLSGREAVRGRLDAALAAWREAGIEAEGVCGDANPMDAVSETWDPRRHDEVIVSTLPGQSSRWIAGRPAQPGRAADRGAGHARGRQRHAAGAARRAAAGARDLTARAARRPLLGRRAAASSSTRLPNGSAVKKRRIPG